MKKIIAAAAFVFLITGTVFANTISTNSCPPISVVADKYDIKISKANSNSGEAVMWLLKTEINLELMNSTACYIK